MNEKETTDKLEVCIKNLNAILQECRQQDVSVAITVEYTEHKNETIYCHKANNTVFKLREVYGKQ